MAGWASHARLGAHLKLGAFAPAPRRHSVEQTRPGSWHPHDTCAVKRCWPISRAYGAARVPPMAALHCWRPGQATVPMCVQLAGMPGPLDAKGRGHWGEDENGQRLQLAAVAHDDSAPHDGDGGEEVMPGCAKLYPQRLLRRQALTTSSTASRTADMEQGTALLRKSPCPSAGCKPSRLFTAIASTPAHEH